MFPFSFSIPSTLSSLLYSYSVSIFPSVFFFSCGSLLFCRRRPHPPFSFFFRRSLKPSLLFFPPQSRFVYYLFRNPPGPRTSLLFPFLVLLQFFFSPRSSGFFFLTFLTFFCFPSSLLFFFSSRYLSSFALCL